MFQSVFVAIANNVFVPPILRGHFLRPAGVYSDGLNPLYRDLKVVGRGRLSIGRGTFINRGCYFGTDGDIMVGPRVFIADHVQIRTEAGASVSIGAGTWLGSGASVGPGVRIGNGCVVAANAVVTTDLAADGLYVGNPAVLHRVLT